MFGNVKMATIGSGFTFTIAKKECKQMREGITRYSKSSNCISFGE